MASSALCYSCRCEEAARTIGQLAQGPRNLLPLACMGVGEVAGKFSVLQLSAGKGQAVGDSWRSGCGKCFLKWPLLPRVVFLFLSFFFGRAQKSVTCSI